MIMAGANATPISPASACEGPAGAAFLAGAGEPGLVSVVIPTYNRGYILAKAVESVLAQSYGAVEIIVVDDGSTDDTGAVVAQFDARVRYVAQTNGGVCAARNAGLRLARGEFIALLDSDDQWLPWKLSAQIAILQARPDIGMVWTDLSAISAGADNAKGAVLSERYLRTFYSAYADSGIDNAMRDAGSLGGFWPGAPAGIASSRVLIGDIFSEMIVGNHVHTSTAVLRRSRLRETGLFDEGLRLSGEDYEFHLRTCYHGPVGLLDAASILYRVDAEDQLTQPAYAIHIARNNLKTVEMWCERGKDRLHLPANALRRRLADSYAWVGESELNIGHRSAAAHSLWRSLRLVRDARVARLIVLCLLPRSLQNVMRTIWNRLQAR